MRQPDWVASLSAGHEVGRPLLLLFDYDGTLAPIVPHPDLAVLPPATRDTLAVLAVTDGVAVGVISGRGIGCLREFVGLPAVWYGGSGGMHLDLGGEVIIDGAAAVFDRVAVSLTERVGDAVRKFAGAWVERKPGCLAVHFRVLSPLDAVVLTEDVNDTLAGFGTGGLPLRSRVVSRAIEIAPAAAWTKGDAVAWMTAAHGRNPLIFYAGDGANDEEAVACVNARGGVTVGIGQRPPPGSSSTAPRR